jgi:hypothetical protein
MVDNITNQNINHYSNKSQTVKVANITFITLTTPVSNSNGRKYTSNKMIHSSVKPPTLMVDNVTKTT